MGTRSLKNLNKHVGKESIMSCRISRLHFELINRVINCVFNAQRFMKYTVQ